MIHPLHSALGDVLPLLHTALDASATAIVITDREGFIRWVNPAYTSLTGYTASEVIGQHTRLHRSGLHSEEFYREMWATILSGAVWHGVLINRRKDGTLYHEEQTLTPVRASGDAISHFIAVKQDVSARVEREHEQRVLASLASALRVARTRDELIPALVEQTRTLFHAEGAALALHDPFENALVFGHAVGACERLLSVRLHDGPHISWRVFHTRAAYRSDATTHDQSAPPLDVCLAGSASVCVPLMAHETPIGVLWVRRGRAFSDAETQLLGAVGDLAGSALHRTTLHEQTEQRLRRLSSLRAIDVAIASSMDIRLTLGVVLDQVVTQLGVDAAAVLLRAPQDQHLAYAAGRGFRTDAVITSRVRLGEGLVGCAALEQRSVRLPLVPAADDAFTRADVLQVEEFVAYAAVPLITKGLLVGMLEVFHRTALHRDAEWYGFLETLAGQAAIAVDNAVLAAHQQRAHAELMLAYDTTLEGWARALDLRDSETEGHSRRVTELALRLARACGVSEADLPAVRRGALLHDIGKIGVPDAILRKPGPLDEHEWEVMRRHPELAIELLAPIAFLQSSLDIPRSHHEHWDGSGYPHGLRGVQIPLTARIFTIVDVWDALTNDRPYRRAWAPAQAQAYLREEAGRKFDPTLVTVFLDLLGQHEPPA